MDIPEGVSVQVDGQKLTVKGPKGEVQKILSKEAAVKVEGNTVDVSAKNSALKGTTESMVKGLMVGVTEGYQRESKILYAHFPVSLEVKGTDVIIKNFQGEKQPRKTKIIGSTKVQVKGQNVTISGPDKEAVGQTFANLRTAMRIKNKDARIFQDGIYETEG